jgi:hypothetical protein
MLYQIHSLTSCCSNQLYALQTTLPWQYVPFQFPSQVHVALPFTSTLHVPLFSQGLLSHGETRNKNGKKCYYSESNTRTTFRMKTFALNYFK